MRSFPCSRTCGPLCGPFLATFPARQRKEWGLLSPLRCRSVALDQSAAPAASESPICCSHSLASRLKPGSGCSMLGGADVLIRGVHPDVEGASGADIRRLLDTSGDASACEGLKSSDDRTCSSCLEPAPAPCWIPTCCAAVDGRQMKSRSLCAGARGCSACQWVRAHAWSFKLCAGAGQEASAKFLSRADAVELPRVAEISEALTGLYAVAPGLVVKDDGVGSGLTAWVAWVAGVGGGLDMALAPSTVTRGVGGAAVMRFRLFLFAFVVGLDAAAACPFVSCPFVCPFVSGSKLEHCAPPGPLTPAAAAEAGWLRSKRIISLRSFLNLSVTFCTTSSRKPSTAALLASTAWASCLHRKRRLKSDPSKYNNDMRGKLCCRPC